MHIDIGQLLPYILPAVTLVVGWLVPSPRQKLAITVLKAVALVEKYYRGAPERQLEDEAVRLITAWLPRVSETKIRLAIRALCADRKAAAEEDGLEAPKGG